VWWYEFTHLTWLVLPHYLVKLKQPQCMWLCTQIHPLTLTTEQPYNAPNYNDNFRKCSDEPHSTNEQEFYSMSSKFPPPACTHDLRGLRHWSIAASIMFRSKSNQVCIKRFCRSSMSQIFVSYTHCCITPQILQSTGPFRWSYKVHLTQFSLVISHCNITFFIFRLSQGSVATLIRWGGEVHISHVSFIVKSKSENCIKIRWMLTKLQTEIRWLLLWLILSNSMIFDDREWSLRSFSCC